MISVSPVTARQVPCQLFMCNVCPFQHFLGLAAAILLFKLRIVPCSCESRVFCEVPHSMHAWDVQCCMHDVASRTVTHIERSRAFEEHEPYSRMSDVTVCVISLVEDSPL